MLYNPGRDFRWLFLRPWVWIPRLLQVLWTLGGLVLVLLLRGGSKSAEVQQQLARGILNTLTGLGPCFIKVGQALSTRPDLVRRDWLEELTRLQDDLPSFPTIRPWSGLNRNWGPQPMSCLLNSRRNRWLPPASARSTRLDWRATPGWR